MGPVEVLVVYPLALVGSVLWFLSPEVLVASYGAAGHHPLLLAALATAGQNTTYVVIFLSGARLSRRWRWLGERARALENRWGARLARSYKTLMCTAAVVGVPPLLFMVLLAPSFRVSLKTTLLITLSLRMLRFTLLALLGDTVVRWLDG
jgi:membrane protein YqaA with SNARE-associated domain